MSWDMTNNNNKQFDFGGAFSEDSRLTSIGAFTPRSRCSTGFDNSAFGSGSSALSSFEPPSDAELFCARQPALNPIYDVIPQTQEELEAVIANLQAIYLYRQGLKALTAERLTSVQNTSPSALSENSGFVQSQSLPPVPTAVPGSSSSIWRMDADSGASSPMCSIPKMSQTITPAEMMDTTDLIMQNQYQQVYQDFMVKEKLASKPSSPQFQGESNSGRRHRRKNHRQNSAPVTLCAPQWADASWNPRSNVKTHSQTAGHGTGVFIPPHLAQGNSKTTSNQENENQQQTYPLQY